MILAKVLATILVIIITAYLVIVVNFTSEVRAYILPLHAVIIRIALGALTIFLILESIWLTKKIWT